MNTGQRRVARIVVRRAAYVVAFVVAGFIGRATIVDGEALSLVWPAAGVALLWFLGGERDRWTWVDAVLLATSAAAVNAVTGASVQLALVFATVNMAQVVTIVALVRRWVPDVVGPERSRRLLTPAALARFSLAIAIGCLVGVLLGITGLYAATGHISVESMLTWWGRNWCGAFAVSVTGILLMGRRDEPADAPRPGGTRPELAGLVLATTGLFVADLSSTYLPLAFFLPAMTAWAGLRFPTVVVAVHALAGGGAAVGLTLAGHGPFAGVDSVMLAALLSQLFVGMTVSLGLFLAISRDEAARLHGSLDRAGRREAEQRETLEAILTSIDEGIVMLDEDGALSWANPSAYHLLPIARLGGEVHGSEVEVYTDDPSLSRVGVSRLGLDEVPTHRVDVRSEEHDEVTLSISSTPVRHDRIGNGSVVVVHDVSRDRQHARELSSFAGVVAHDLLNPITGISSWSELLADSLASRADVAPAEVAMAERITSIAARMSDLVNDLLADSRARERRLDLRETDPATIAHDIVATRDISAWVTVHAVPAVHADPFLLRQLLDNLIANAVKYSRPGSDPEVVVDGVVDRDSVIIRVSDRGLGVPDGQHHQIFERFHRAHGDAQPGTGLGLAICRAIAVRHGGHVRALPNPGGGTVVELELPHHQSDLALPA